MHHHVTYMFINFEQNRVGRSVKTVQKQIYLQIIAICISLQLRIVILKKIIVSDMHHRITYMYINFQQNRSSRSVKAVHTIIFANNRKLHKFATTNSNFEKINYFRQALSYNVHVYDFSYIFANNCKLHKFATTNSNFEKMDYFSHDSSYNVYVYQFSAKSG